MTVEWPALSHYGAGKYDESKKENYQKEERGILREKNYISKIEKQFLQKAKEKREQFSLGYCGLPGSAGTVFCER